ncbi:septum formation initiator family protein [Leadbetterella sp. DM7]|uniref:FtsB family cell division protein n=1 Tax=Leadbetterella sp. DM7 TaxID=3235085 RepID=UPI00349E9DF0
MKNRLLSFVTRYRFYVISTLILFCWLAFFDRSNLIKQAEMQWQLNEVENEIGYYETALKKVREEEKDVLGSEASMEKYAREKYFLKREGETVFVLVDEEDKVITE